MTHAPVFDVLIDGESLVGIVDELPTIDPIEANLVYEMALGFIHDEPGREALQVVELVVSVQRGSWNTVRAGWAFNGDWMWFAWHGDVVLVFTGQPCIADYGSLPVGCFRYRPEGGNTTPEEFMNACRDFEVEHQEMLDQLWGGRERRRRLRRSIRSEA